jgi:hypothetical protein
MANKTTKEIVEEEVEVVEELTPRQKILKARKINLQRKRRTYGKTPRSLR